MTHLVSMVQPVIILGREIIVNVLRVFTVINVSIILLNQGTKLLRENYCLKSACEK